MGLRRGGLKIRGLQGRGGSTVLAGLVCSGLFRYVLVLECVLQQRTWVGLKRHHGVALEGVMARRDGVPAGDSVGNVGSFNGGGPGLRGLGPLCDAGRTRDNASRSCRVLSNVLIMCTNSKITSIEAYVHCSC